MPGGASGVLLFEKRGVGSAIGADHAQARAQAAADARKINTWPQENITTLPGMSSVCEGS